MPDTRAEQIRVPPHSDEVEQKLLGCVFLDSRTYWLAKQVGIHAAVFYRESHRHAWRTFDELVSNGSEIDVVTVNDRLSAKGVLEQCGGAGWVSGLSVEVPSTVSAESYAQRLVELYQLRQLVKAADAASDCAHDPANQPAEIAEQLRSQVGSVLLEAGGSRGKYADDLGEWLLEAIDRRLAGEEKAAASLGIDWLDDVLGGGLSPADMILLAGLYKAGKSKLALFIALAALKTGWTVSWWSTEMTPEELTARFVSALSGARESLIEDPREATELELARIRKAAEEFRDLRQRLHIILDGRPRVADIEVDTVARAGMLNQSPPRLLTVVDYVQACTAGMRGVGVTEPANIAAVSQGLNAIAKSTATPMLAVWQLAPRRVEDRQEKNKDYVPLPRPGDLRGSTQGALDANQMLLVHRPWRDAEEGDKRGSFCVVDRGLVRSGSRALRFLSADLACNWYSPWIGEAPSPFGKSSPPSPANHKKTWWDEE